MTWTCSISLEQPGIMQGTSPSMSSTMTGGTIELKLRSGCLWSEVCHRRTHDSYIATGGRMIAISALLFLLHLAFWGICTRIRDMYWLYYYEFMTCDVTLRLTMIFPEMSSIRHSAWFRDTGFWVFVSKTRFVSQGQCQLGSVGLFMWCRKLAEFIVAILSRRLGELNMITWTDMKSRDESVKLN